ncbi:outer membrane protein assembly factor BamB [Thiobacillus sp.]|uniref:outer membrane protein assembly factor BamB n=1 Tax=Thiobacillus sp. TaxID=924 RepID=UPI0025E3F52E|nr:outer membrane protein assembly factor BamB [Thiobacillus sp.]MBT9539625.1 outer membrane protein assembly factor BamB [Thiobacillus sp.]
MKKPLLVASLILAVSGCSTVSDWVGMGPDKPKPAALVEFTATAALSQAWKAESGESQGYLFSPQADGDAVYAAGGDQVVSIGLSSGRTHWKVESEAKLSAGTGVGQGLVLAGGSKGELLALDQQTGQQRWKVALSSEVIGQMRVQSDTVIVRTGDGRVQGLAIADGSRKWLYSRNLPVLSLRGSGGMVVRDDVLYAGFPGGKLVALNATNGAQLWEATVALPRGATELERVADVMGNPVVDMRQVCAVAYQGRVACFDRTSGAPLWARETSSNSGLAMDERNVYVSDDKDTVTAYDKSSGRAGWKQDKLARRQITAPLALGAWVVVADSEGYVHVLSADDGSFVARAQAGGAVRTAPVDIGPGFAVQTGKGDVVAFKLN